MRRVLTLVTLAIAALAPARRAAAAPGGGTVTGVSIVPTAGKAEVVIAVDGSVNVEDFTLTSPDRIVLDVNGATLGVAPRLYDRVARGGITNVRYAQYRRDVVRVVIELDGAHPYDIVRGDHDLRVAVQSGNARFAAWHADDVTAATSAVAQRSFRPAPAAPAASQPRITVTYQDADIRDVLAAFAAFSGRTIVVGKGVEGKVTAEVRDQPWDVAMRAILQSQGLDAAEANNGIITVDSYAAILDKQASEPLTTQLLTLNYARAATLVETAKGLLSKDCGAPSTPGGRVSSANCNPRGTVSADTSTNTLLITEVPSRMADVMSYIRSLDIRTPQVVIKAKIILVDRTSIEDLGLKYDLGSQGTFFNKLVQRAKSYTLIDTNGDGIPDSRAADEMYQPAQNVITLGGNQLAAIANANQNVPNPALSLIFSTALGNFSLSAFLDALQNVSLADVQAEPTITTLDNRRAELLVGEETPIRIVDASAASANGPRSTVTFKQTGIMLGVTPHVTANRQILMQVHAERSNVNIQPSDIGYNFAMQRTDNQLLVDDGETAVIGGLTVTSVNVAKEGIPLLVDLPFIGKLFGHTSTKEQKQDLLILVTPHIVDDATESTGSANR